MKKILTIIVCVLCAYSCTDDNTDMLSVMINVSYNGEIASPTLVRLYAYETAKDFDNSYMATMEYGDDQVLKDKLGNDLHPVYTSDTFSGINTFEDINAGTYLAVILYKPDGYTYPMYYLYGIKAIRVDESNNAKLHNIEFTYDHDRGKFIEFLN